MAKLTIDGKIVEAAEGAPLVEVIKQNGFYVSNLCYIDKLPPYAGCRTCLVEIEGARGFQLACTATVRDDMVVNTATDEVKEARQFVLSVINANHSDRCLTCHRRVKCMPGDICLRDDVVTHRCLTCSKNYRCELQTTNDLLDMGKDNVEPWEGEDRTYYEAPQPEPDRSNPFLEFDPQMCIICTRCVRACDDLRHTGAVTLAGRGFSTTIAFGAGGAIDESNCDFCGSCIDVCPTAALMEKPNKWLARTEDWVSTVCNSCSVGCTISIGHRDGKPVIVKPETLNPFSDDQICVRGRFHYDAVKQSERLSEHLLRNGDKLEAVTWEETLDYSVEQLAAVYSAHGAEAIAFLGSPIATNEENYLVQRIAREVVGTPHIDFSAGPVNRAVVQGTAAAFGTDTLPGDLTNIPERVKTILVIADDLEESHNIAALRIKDAIDPRKLPLREAGRLIVISARRGELCDFAEPYGGVWLQPEPGQEAGVLAALAQSLAGDSSIAAAADASGLNTTALAAADPKLAGDSADALERAASILRDAAAADNEDFAIVFAPKPSGATLARETAKAAANVALLVNGASAVASFFVLPTEANVNGALDMGVTPGADGKDIHGILDAALAGDIKALVVVGDNPMMHVPGRAHVQEALSKLDSLIVVDQLLSETAEQAGAVIADVPTYGKDGTFTNADRRVQRLRAAQAHPGDAKPAWESLSALGARLAAKIGKDVAFAYDELADVTEEITRTVPGYDKFHFFGYMGWGKGRAVVEAEAGQIALQPVEMSPAPTNGDGQLTLLTGRTLFTSLEGATLRLADADKLHREDGVLVNQLDAVELNIAADDVVVLQNGAAELSLKVTLTTNVPRGSVFVSTYYSGGAISALLPSENGSMAVPRVKLVKADA